jgi:hypothetical protein
MVNMRNGFCQVDGTRAKTGLPVSRSLNSEHHAPVPALTSSKYAHASDFRMLHTTTTISEDYIDAGIILNLQIVIKDLKGFMLGI